jgi:hypothetical protein
MDRHVFRYLDRNGNGWTREVRCETITEAMADLKSNPDACSIVSWTVHRAHSIKPAVLWSEIVWPLQLSGRPAPAV